MVTFSGFSAWWCHRFQHLIWGDTWSTLGHEILGLEGIPTTRKKTGDVPEQADDRAQHEEILRSDVLDSR